MSRILEVKDLSIAFNQNKKSLILADQVSFSVEKGECLGILGESGSGKSIACKAIMGLLDNGFQIDGEANFEGQNLLNIKGEVRRKIRGKDICMILQNPMTCFDPLYRIGYQMNETFLEHTHLSLNEIKKKSIETLEIMQIKNPEEVIKKYPHQLSGGMLQRVMIGLTLAMKPKLIIADEPTTAIDSITQFEIIKEFIKIKQMHQSALIFISHDLGVISKIADNVVVMHKSKVVQQGTLERVFRCTEDPYTRSLIEKRLVVMERFEKVMGIKRGSVTAKNKL